MQVQKREIRTEVDEKQVDRCRFSNEIRAEVDEEEMQTNQIQADKHKNMRIADRAKHRVKVDYMFVKIGPGWEPLIANMPRHDVNF
ncbi:hypothetical protein Tco_0656744 [Tanacetum coccineum]|uniref:Uncharacterized protein n=1 Tax=Tanacetum coccineum TaxID=301880 RepID=A0ABQ4XAR5_9ASTR